MVRPEKKTILIFSTIFTCSILHFDLQFYKKSKFDIKKNIRFDEFINGEDETKAKVEKKSSLKTVCQTVLASLVYVVRGDPADEC